MSPQHPSQDVPYCTLNGAQTRLRDAYFAHESGLFVMNAVPGAGKSVTVADLAARDLLRRHAAGHPAPEDTLTVLTFNTEQAEELAPKITDRLQALVAHDATPAAAAMTDAALATLTRGVRQAASIGTVDGLLRAIFGDILHAVGFNELPAVGDDLHLQQLHAALYAELAADDSVNDCLRLLVDAYPPGDYVDAPASLLRQGLTICRQQRLSTAEFGDRLLESVEAVYPEGPPEDVDGFLTALERILDDSATNALDDVTDAEGAAITAADTALYEDWQEAIEAYITALTAYRRRYRDAIREHEVLSHTDVAYLVATFLDGTHPAATDHPKLRERVLGRYRHRLQSVIIDEAQDISTIQHDALAPLVTGETRVCLAGDLRQSIYVWRDAQPSLFARAIQDGHYFNRDWSTHVVETTRTTYRARPGIAGAIDAICEPMLTDDARGNLATFEVEYPRLDPARAAVEGANVHVAAYEPTGAPGTPWSIASDGGGEAPALAAYLAAGRDRGIFDVEGDDPSMMVLFRWRTHMDAYREAFEAAGLSVANAASYLFEAQTTTIALDVLDWLADPARSDSLKDLVRDSTLGIQALEPAFAAADWSLHTLVETAPNRADFDDTDRGLLDGLVTLQRQAPALRTQPIPATIRTIVDTLRLRADAFDLTGTDPTQRVANCDALEAYFEDTTSDVEVDLDEFLHRLAHVRDAPYTGPSQPVPATDADVVFQTIHQAKGDEADVVALADPGFPLHKHGPVGERLIVAPGVVALAPPASAAGTITTADDDTVDLGPYGGLYTPTANLDPNTQGIFPIEGGIRWASERWDHQGFSGHDHLQRAVATTRAESWRLLYVALTRARDHLVLPLPWSIPGTLQPRDRWLDTLIEGVDFTGIDTSRQYALDAPQPRRPRTDRQVRVTATDADAIEAPEATPEPADRALPMAANAAVEADALPAFIPRFIRPSTLKPLADDLDEHVLAHLQTEPLHTDTGNIDPDLPLAIEAMDADDIGRFAHEVITRAITADLDERDLRNRTPVFEGIVEAALDAHGPPASRAERKGLNAFLQEYVIPDFLDSQLWADLERATDVYTEVPVRDEVAPDRETVEVEGQVDILLELPEDRWQVVDLKIALTAPTDEIRERYRLQVGLYAALVEPTVGGEVERVVETVGVASDRSTSPWPDLDAKETLKEIAAGSGTRE
ncbi:MAG: UvrD-helicase domain-containing protein [Halodesulfurarchaeum sp.]